MKKILLTIATCFFAAIIVHAQDVARNRKISPGEMALYTKMHDAMYAAIPHTYKDWKSVGDHGDGFDAHWVFDPTKSAGLKDLIPDSYGTVDSYYYSVDMRFTMPDEQVMPLMVAALKSVTDMNDPKQISSAFKGKDKSMVFITMSCNTNAKASYGLTHCAEDPLVNLSIPVPTTLALMGIHSAKCPFMQGDKPDMTEDNYYDDALIFLGGAVVSQHPQNLSNGQVGNNYEIGFNKTKLKSFIVQNIVVTIRGDQEDIQAVIKLIDWQKLYATLDK